LQVSHGYEAALGAALGEDLTAPVDETAPSYWFALADYTDAPGLPGGVEPLARFVVAPAALARRLKTPVIASGGIASLDDLAALHAHESDGIAGAIIGRALYDVRIDLKRALALVSA